MNKTNVYSLQTWLIVQFNIILWLLNRSGPRDGIPGTPGSADLAEALRRLTPAAVYARRAALSSGSFGVFLNDSECRTPDSIMSTSCYSGDSFNNVPWKLPDKLQVSSGHATREGFYLLKK